MSSEARIPRKEMDAVRRRLMTACHVQIAHLVELQDYEHETVVLSSDPAVAAQTGYDMDVLMEEALRERHVYVHTERPVPAPGTCVYFSRPGSA